MELARRTEIPSRTVVVIPFLDLGEDRIYVGFVERVMDGGKSYELLRIGLEAGEDCLKGCARGLKGELGYIAGKHAIQPVAAGADLEIYKAEIPLKKIVAKAFRGWFYTFGFNKRKYGSKWDEQMDKCEFYPLNEAKKLVDEAMAGYLDML